MLSAIGLKEQSVLTLLHSEQPKHNILAVLSAIG